MSHIAPNLRRILASLSDSAVEDWGVLPIENLGLPVVVIKCIEAYGVEDIGQLTEIVRHGVNVPGIGSERLSTIRAALVDYWDRALTVELSKPPRAKWRDPGVVAILAGAIIGALVLIVLSYLSRADGSLGDVARAIREDRHNLRLSDGRFESRMAPLEEANEHFRRRADYSDIVKPLHVLLRQHDASLSTDIFRRIAKLLLDYTSADFDRVLTHVPPKVALDLEVDNIHDRDLVMCINQIVGDVLYAKERWSAALPHYYLLLRMQPASVSAMIDVSLCHLWSKNYASSVDMINSAIERIKEGVPPAARAERLAATLAIRAMAIRKSGKLESSIRDIDRSIELYTGLPDSRTVRVQEQLAHAKGIRGNTLRLMLKLGEARRAFDEAVLGYRAVVSAAPYWSKRRDLARCLNGRSAVRYEEGDHKGAEADIDEAISIGTELLQDGHKSLSKSLAGFHLNRAQQGWRQNRLVDAAEELSLAIAIYKREVGDEPSDVHPALASALASRSIVRRLQRDFNGALSDASSAVSICLIEVARQKSDSILMTLAESRLALANVQIELGERSAAEELMNEVIRYYESRVDAQGQVRGIRFLETLREQRRKLQASSKK